MEPLDLLQEKLRRAPPATQEDCCAEACRRAMAAIGPVDERDIPAASAGIARGLFGSAYDNADFEQQEAWNRMAEREYRKAIGSTPTE